ADFKFWHASGMPAAVGDVTDVSDARAGDFNGDQGDDLLLIDNGHPLYVSPLHGTGEWVGFSGQGTTSIAVVRGPELGERDTRLRSVIVDW
ncbi:MAG: hypothetical protein ACI841_003033, partial [Planctomycetota bacterium]